MAFFAARMGDDYLARAIIESELVAVRALCPRQPWLGSYAVDPALNLIRLGYPALGRGVRSLPTLTHFVTALLAATRTLEAVRLDLPGLVQGTFHLDVGRLPPASRARLRAQAECLALEEVSSVIRAEAGPDAGWRHVQSFNPSARRHPALWELSLWARDVEPECVVRPLTRELAAGLLQLMQSASERNDSATVADCARMIERVGAGKSAHDGAPCRFVQWAASHDKFLNDAG